METHPASHDIASSLGQELDRDLTLSSWQAVSGGSIHQSWKVISGDGEPFFIKTNRRETLPMFEAEAAGLCELKQCLSRDNPLHIPSVINTGFNHGYAWLVLEYLPLSRYTSETERLLGTGLAMLHQRTNKLFGLPQNNYIGESIQENNQCEYWLDFFRKHRLEVQFRLAAEHGFYNHIRAEAEHLLDKLHFLLYQHQPKASLLHGDLWSGNKGAINPNRATIFDPAVYYGDRECDLAMTELFGGFSSAFYDAYEAVYPIESGYSHRKELYNLYHILNHANLFGGHYIEQSRNIMQRLIRSVS